MFLSEASFFFLHCLFVSMQLKKKKDQVFYTVGIMWKKGGKQAKCLQCCVWEGRGVNHASKAWEEASWHGNVPCCVYIHARTHTELALICQQV